MPTQTIRAFASRGVRRLDRYLGGRSRGDVMCAALALAVALGVVDYLTW